MGRARAFWARATGFLTRSRRDLELQEELASHLELQIEDNLRAGMAPDQARREALLKLGGVAQARELYREQQGLPLLDTLAQDVRLGLRMMRRSPGFTAVALAVLALGIGANSVMFTLVNTLLLRPLPYPDAYRLLRVQTVDADLRDSATAVPDFHEYRARNHSLEGLASYYTRAFDVTGRADPERIRALVVSSDFLGVLRTPPVLGRDLQPGDERWGDHRVAILTDALWRSRFAADPAVVGGPVTLSGQPYTVVGVLPQGFSFLGMRPAGARADVLRARRQPELAQQLLPDHGGPPAARCPAGRGARGPQRHLAVDHPRVSGEPAARRSASSPCRRSWWAT